MLRWLERIAWIAGIALLGIYVGVRASSERARLEAIVAVEAARESAAHERPHPESSLIHQVPDTSLWSPGRINAWRRAADGRERPQGILRIASVDLAVPIFDGTSEANLNRGAGWIEGTARIGERGNVGLAAHRDGYFRALKDVRVGDELELTTEREVLRYRIVDTFVVEPTAVDVLARTSSPSVTLVTCYPFYFIGSAPQRFIVRAELLEPARNAPRIARR